MKVKEIIEKLSSLDQDAEVFLYCDHGQSVESSFAVETEKFHEVCDNMFNPEELQECDSTMSRDVVIIYS